MGSSRAVLPVDHRPGFGAFAELLMASGFGHRGGSSEGFLSGWVFDTMSEDHSMAEL